MQDYELRCTAEQTRRAYALGAPINDYDGVIYDFDERGCISVEGTPVLEIEQDEKRDWFYIPTTQQMIGWMREQGVWIYVKGYRQYNTFYACLQKQGLTRAEFTDDFEKPEQAELAAIDVALDYLEKKGGTK